MKSIIKTKKGLTLVEVILYVALVSLITSTIVYFAVNLTQVDIKQETVSKVERSGDLIAEAIKRSVRQADSVDDPTAENSGATLELSTSLFGEDPTTFSMNGTNIEVEYGVSSAIQINLDGTSISGLDFIHVENDNDQSSVTFEYTVSSSSTSTRNEYDYSKTFKTSATLRK